MSLDGVINEALATFPTDPEFKVAQSFSQDSPPEKNLGLSKNEKSRGETVCLKRLSDVKPEKILWLWEGRLARGKLTIIMGDPGLGKSFATLDFASRITKARKWPDGTHAPIGNVVLLNAEDGIADTIRPRVDALDGDPSRIHVLEGIRSDKTDRPFCLQMDLFHLEKVIEETRPVLTVIDPLSAYMGDTETYKDSEVRGLLAPLAALANRTGTAILAVMHMTKGSQTKAIYRAPGSIGFVGAARIVLGVGKDPDDEKRSLLVPVKINISSPPTSLAFTIDDGVLNWDPVPIHGLNADTIFAPAYPGDKSATDEALDWLRNLLADGPIRAGDVQKEARKAGIGDKPLRTARERLCNKPYRKEFAGGWWWEMRPHTSAEDAQCAQDDQHANIQKQGIFEGGGHLRGDGIQHYPSSNSNPTSSAFIGPVHLDDLADPLKSRGRVRIQERESPR